MLVKSGKLPGPDRAGSLHVGVLQKLLEEHFTEPSDQGKTPFEAISRF